MTDNIEKVKTITENDELFTIDNLEDCIERLRGNHSESRRWMFVPPSFQDKLFLKGFASESLLVSDIKGKLQNNKITIQNANIKEYLVKLEKNGNITIEIKTSKNTRHYTLYNFPEIQNM